VLIYGVKILIPDYVTLDIAEAPDVLIRYALKGFADYVGINIS
jgi:hypothetical protein